MGAVTDAAEAGDRRAELVAMRKRCAEVIDRPATHPRDLVMLSRRLMDIGVELERLDLEASAKADDDVSDVQDEPWDEGMI